VLECQLAINLSYRRSCGHSSITVVTFGGAATWEDQKMSVSHFVPERVAGGGGSRTRLPTAVSAALIWRLVFAALKA
jgi:hypothetical protein